MSGGTDDKDDGTSTQAPATPKETKQPEDEPRNEAVMQVGDEKVVEKKSSGAYAKRRTFTDWLKFIEQMVDLLLAQLPVFTHSNFVEVQERVSSRGRSAPG